MSIFDVFSQYAQERAAEAQAEAERNQRAAERARSGSATAYQDQLMEELKRMQNQHFRGRYEKRTFHCAGWRWEASVWVDME